MEVWMRFRRKKRKKSHPRRRINPRERNSDYLMIELFLTDIIYNQKFDEKYD
jgi:hypothetical protein